eukprot:CAMPEP_0117011394 /NCGR_PEP_ID=MMETSP0472-20121206/9802_1 /TAXON_ID=693140 ORGANISM="Tiarina fusus, Strain LIS" /NCGR_SAMPLE_ID=MMETSP0472 /ASSEMBLY_ACC=CAM_ASM_000603 /LENGTH=613 /DNA_ID=CAMNT_0004714175 /DNA_START=159 /DNA_END=2000 /DNA_ORIENTATION=-
MELLSTETTFVNILTFMVEKFLQPMRDQQIVDETALRAVFANVESILMLNKTLLDETAERMANWGLEVKIGDVFLKITEFLKVYIDYVKNYENALQTLTDLKKENGALRKFLKVQMRQCDGHTYETLESFLITPVQRIPRYNLLLGEIVKNTPRGHPDYDDLVSASEKVQETARYVNERAREAEQLAKVYTIQNQITGKFDRDLVSPDRRLIQEGELVQIYGSKGKMRNLYCIVFNDTLVCCKTENTSRFASIKRGSRIATNTAQTQQFEYLDRISLGNKKLTLLEEDGESDYFFFRIEGVDGDSTDPLILGAGSEKDRQQWAELLSQQIDDTTEKLCFYDKQKEEVAKKRANDARTLIQETYIRHRVHGQNSTENLTRNSQPGVRKFAQRKQNMSLTPSQKLKFIETAEEQTTELLKEESQLIVEREKEAKAKSDEFKSSTKDRYINKPDSNESSPSNPKLRKFASLKRKTQDPPSSTVPSNKGPPRKVPPPVPTRRPFGTLTGTSMSSPRSPREEELSNPALVTKRNSFAGSLKLGSWKSKKNSPRSPRKEAQDDAALHRNALDKANEAKSAITSQYSPESNVAADSPDSGLRSWARRRTVGSQVELPVTE